MQHRFNRQAWLRSAFFKSRALDKKHFTKADAEAKMGKKGLADVAMQWELPTPGPWVSMGQASGESYIGFGLHTDNPLVDWFTKDEYIEFLTDIE